MPESQPDAQTKPQLIHVAGSAQTNVAQHERLVSVIDDDVWVGESLTELLESHGLDALAYASGADFLGDGRHRQSGCLIIDQHMPGMNGLEVVRALHHEGVFVPTILISGRVDADLILRARQLDVTAVLEKPFAVARLVELVRTALGSHG